MFNPSVKMDHLSNSLLSPSSLPIEGMNGSPVDNLFGSGSCLLSGVGYDGNTLKELQDEKIRSASLQRELSKEKKRRREAERELEDLKKYMFTLTDMSSMFGTRESHGDEPLTLMAPLGMGMGTAPGSSLSPDVPSYTPGLANKILSQNSPLVAPFVDTELRSDIISGSLELLGEKDILFLDNDIMSDLDVLSAKLFTTVSGEAGSASKRESSRHNFGKPASEAMSPGSMSCSISAPNLTAMSSGAPASRTTSGDLTIMESPSTPMTTGSGFRAANNASNAPIDAVKKRSEGPPLNVEELEKWLKCKTDFRSKWMQQKSEFMEKWNFCQEQFMDRWMKEVSSRFRTEEVYEYPIKCFIYHILSTRGPQPCGEIGKILKEITQNNEVHLMQMIKINYKGLKKFIELFNDMFQIGTEHPFNPTVYLINRNGLPPPFPSHLIGNLEYVNEILELGLRVCNVENEFMDRPALDDSTSSLASGYSSSPGPYYEAGVNGSGYYHRNLSLSTDGPSSRSTSGASHTSHETSGRTLSHEMRNDHLFYDSATDTWTSSGGHMVHSGHAGGHSNHYSGGYEKGSVHGNKPPYYSSRNVKRPSQSNIFNLNAAVAVDTMRQSTGAKDIGSHRKK